MLSKLKIQIARFFHNVVSLSGYRLIGRKKIVKHNDFDSIHKFLITYIQKKEELNIFDVGANTGQSIERFRKIFPNSKIYSFEPDPKLFKILKNKYENHKNIILKNFGLSDENAKREFFSHKYNTINSFIEIDKKSKLFNSRLLNVNLKDNVNFTEKVILETKKLDDLVFKEDLKHIDILKIDTQGFEDNVLNGSKQFLKDNKISIIELELILGFGYKKELSFYSIEKILQEFDYKLIAIDQGSNVLSYSNYQVDLIYVKREIFESIKKIHEDNISIKNVTKSTNKNNPYSY